MIRLAFIGRLLVGAALLIGCGGNPAAPDAVPLKHCPFGDLSAPTELTIVHLDAANLVVDTMPMAGVPMQKPPQGGWIMLLGVRARNIDGCQLSLTTALVDAVDGQILQVDRRPAMLEPAADGWGVTTNSTFGNLPVCPQLTATRDLYNQPYIVRVVAADGDGRSAEASMTVTPTCPAEASDCSCLCARDYVLGRDCSLPAAR